MEVEGLRIGVGSILTEWRENKGEGLDIFHGLYGFDNLDEMMIWGWFSLSSHFAMIPLCFPLLIFSLSAIHT